MRALLTAAALLLSGCGASHKTQVMIPEGASLAGLKRYGVLPFADARGKGAPIADAVEAGLRAQFYEVADRKPIVRALEGSKPDKDFGLSAEVFETIRRETGADAIIQGKVSPDWTFAVVNVYETDLGDLVMRAVLRPRGRQRKRFDTPDEVAAELVRALTDRR